MPSRSGGCRRSHDLAEHSAVAPKVTCRSDGLPDRRTRGDGIDTAEDRFANLHLGSKTVFDQFNINGGINLSNVVGGRGDFRLADVGRSITLRRDVGLFDVIEVDQLKSANTDRRELQCDLAADGSDADHGHEQFLQSALWHEVRLALEAVGGFRHGPPPRKALTD